MDQLYNAEVQAIEAIIALERAWKVLPKRAYQEAKHILTQQLRDAYLAGHAAGVRGVRECAEIIRREGR